MIAGQFQKRKIKYYDKAGEQAWNLANNGEIDNAVSLLKHKKNYLEIGRIYYANQDVEKALYYLNKSLMQNNVDKSRPYYEIGMIYYIAAKDTGIIREYRVIHEQ